MLFLAGRNLLRNSLLVQLYNDFFTYGYEFCVSIDYNVPECNRIEIIAALYYLFERRWIFFNIEQDKTVSAYIRGSGIDIVEDLLSEGGDLFLSQLYGNLLKRVSEPQVGGNA